MLLPFRQFAWLSLSLGMLLLANSGCTRAWWRKQADDDVRKTVAEKNGYFDYGDVTPPADSRLSDPFDPDCEPMPPDDPTSHQLMHCVDGHRGWKHWHDKGDAPFVDAQTWQSSLPRDEKGEVVLDLVNSVRVARKQSREYQTELEDLYLSALDVTFQRFRFDAQFFAQNATTSTFDGVDRSGPDGRSVLRTTTTGSVGKLTASGGEFTANLANSLMWQFSGSDSEMIGSVLDFSLKQPLLQFGGRAYVLAGLTLAERRLLANVRQMQQFRQGFYVKVVTGQSSGDGPSPNGAVGQKGLGVLAGTPTGRVGSPPIDGFLGVLQEQQRLRNQTGNLAALRDSVTQFEFMFTAGRVQRLQVDQTRQAYYNTQSSLLTARAAYAGRVDRFKINLGLPPSLPIRVADPMIDRFNFFDPDLTTLLDQINNLLEPLRSESVPPEEMKLPERYRELLAFGPRMLRQLDSSRADLDKLLATSPQRVLRLNQLREQTQSYGYDVASELFDAELIGARIEKHQVRLAKNSEEFEKLMIATRALSVDELREKPKEGRKALLELTTELSGVVLESMLIQASIRLEAVELIPLEVSESQALETARQHRLDWMNVRANLVDAWRQIEVTGNELQSGLDLTVSGDLGTRGDNPTEFTADKGRLRMGLEFDSPITRLAERNKYRETLIEYQHARRDYMLFEDQISQSLRNTLRIIDLGQINFEIRRAAVLVAASQVAQARLRLVEPPKGPLAPGVAAQAQTTPTAARDLVSALNDLLDAQNDFLNSWIGFEVLRVLLDFEMGTMQLNQEGLWIDPGPIAPKLSLPPDPSDLESGTSRREDATTGKTWRTFPGPTEITGLTSRSC
ncbi:MAG: hypothetical protein DWI21_15225 [Planctomycetota bacterium]|nr:MAG: hypothetical protein DWI21_15225 [Planctomycetota bacterium]